MLLDAVGSFGIYHAVFGTYRLKLMRSRFNRTVMLTHDLSEIKSKHTKDSTGRLFIMTQTHNLQVFGGNPLCQATKRHLNNS